LGYRVAIYDRDSGYLWKLISYINEKEDKDIWVCGYTDKDSLLKAMEYYSLDMILAGMDMDCTGIECPLLYMGEDKDICNRMGYVYKYQHIDGVTEQILRFAGNNAKKRYGNSKIICVFSPLGRCGKTTLAKNLVWYIGDSIYFGMEEYLPFGDYDWKEEIAYYLSVQDISLFEYVDNLSLNERGAGYMYLADTYQDGANISKDNMEWFIRELKNRRKLNCIVFDVGQGVLGDWNIFSLFDRIIVPCLKDNESVKKMEYFKRILEVRTTKEVSGKMEYIYIEDFNWDNIGEIL